VRRQGSGAEAVAARREGEARRGDGGESRGRRWLGWRAAEEQVGEGSGCGAGKAKHGAVAERGGVVGARQRRSMVGDFSVSSRGLTVLREKDAKR
jgi:hypothetical protein